MKSNYLTLLFLFVILASGCDKDEDCETNGLTYTDDISTILNSNCSTSGCHDSGTVTTFSMTNYEETNAAVGFGGIVGAITHDTAFIAMPFGQDQLDQCTIDQITQWIADGAPE